MSLLDDLLACQGESARQSMIIARTAETEAAVTEDCQRMTAACQAARFVEALPLNDLVIALNIFRQEKVANSCVLVPGKSVDFRCAWGPC